MKTKKLVLLSLFVAIIILMAFTPIGYLRIGALSITFLTIPVVIGAVVLGPAEGAFLGLVFGLTSFLQCFTGDWFASTLFNINPCFYAIMCIIPRILAGLVPGLLFRLLSRYDGKKIWSSGVSALSCSVVNTVGFVGTLILLFATAFSGNAQSFFDAMLSGNAIPEATVSAVIAILVTANAAIEAVVCTVVGSAVSVALIKAFSKRKY